MTNIFHGIPYMVQDGRSGTLHQYFVESTPSRSQSDVFFQGQVKRVQFLVADHHCVTQLLGCPSPKQARNQLFYVGFTLRLRVFGIIHKNPSIQGLAIQAPSLCLELRGSAWVGRA